MTKRKLEQVKWYNDKIEHSSGRLLEWRTVWWFSRWFV